jgi:hypothetical protein
VTPAAIARTAELEFGRLGDDVDHAGRGVLAEDGALRPLQHLDALQLAQVAERHAAARAIDAIDHRPDRRFQAGVVADGADAANPDRGLRPAAGRGDAEAGSQDLQVLHVAHTRVLKLLARHHVHDDRNVLEVLLPLLGGDDDRLHLGSFGLGHGGGSPRTNESQHGARRGAFYETHQSSPYGRLCRPYSTG